MSAALQNPAPPMPDGVRIARQGDEARLWDICMAAFENNGLGRLDPDAVHATIAKGCEQRDGVVFAVIEEDGRAEAVLGLVWTKLWYSADWYWSDLLLFVRPEHRGTKHAVTLVRFARWWATVTDMHVELGIASLDDLERKEKFLGRHATRMGSFYVINPHDGDDR